MTFEYNPARRALVVGDSRLTKVLQREPEACAAISEYASRTGIATDRVIGLLGQAVDEGVLGFEIWADEIFVHTAPYGRPSAPHLPEVAPNLWEYLRSEGRSVEDAYTLWRLTRGLERAGWDVETNPRRILFNMLVPPVPPALGLRTVGQVVPLVVHPTPAELADPRGPLSIYAGCGAQAAGVVCDSGELDAMVTAARRWALERGGYTNLAVLVLEAPRYAPTLLQPGDASVAPRSISVDALTGHGLCPQ